MTSFILELEIILALASAAGAVAIALGATGASLNRKCGSTEILSSELSHIEKRLRELEVYLSSQESVEKTNRWSVGFLTVGQYIVGGILATSFIQETLSGQIIGFLGVLVLVSQVVHQRFRPDLRAASARERAVCLKRLLRLAHDKLDRIRIEYMDDTPERLIAENKIASLISAQIAHVEEVEQQELNNFESLQSQDEKGKSA